jgi:CRISPR-associated protein Cmr2
MAVNYRRKLYAFLQNPDFSEWGGGLLDRLQCIMPERAALDDWWEQHQALLHDVVSSSDRLDLPKREIEHPIARHPISGQTYPLQSLPPSPLDFSNAYSNVLSWEDAEKVYWWFWRFYPEMRSGKAAIAESMTAEASEAAIASAAFNALLEPAHTVLPDCPLHSYQTTVAALAGACFNETGDQAGDKGGDATHPYLLLFSFSPIQDFIKASRKFLDFWAGSYLLHYLSARLCWKIAKLYGPDAVITPSLWHQEIIDTFLLREYEDFSEFFEALDRDGHNPISRWQKDQSSSLSTAGFPNAIVALVPGQAAAAALGEILTKTLREEWEQIGERVHHDIRQRVAAYAKEQSWESLWNKIVANSPKAKDNAEPYQRDLKQWAYQETTDRDGKPHWLYPNWQWKSLWDAQIQNAWEPYWTAIPLGKVGQSLQIEKDQFASDWTEQQNAIAQPPEPIPSQAELDLYQQLNVGTYWGSLQQRLRITLEAVKQTRSWKVPIAPGSRSSISGQFTAMHPSLNYKKFPDGGGIPEGSMRFFWWLMAQVYPGLFDGSEQLNALELTKRMAWVHGGVADSLGIEVSQCIKRIDRHRKLAQYQDAQRLLYERFVRFPNASSIAAARFIHDNPEQVDRYWNELWSQLQPDQHRQFRRLTRIRATQLPKTDQKVNPQQQKAGNFNGVMFSSKWLAEDMNLDLRETEQLRASVQQAHRALGFGDGNPSDWWVMLLADGDGMGDYVSGQKLEKYDKYLDPQAIELDGLQLDALFQTKKRMGPATHVGLNRALLDFSNRLVPYLTEQRFCGKVVYSGGDDVMSVLPLEDLPDYVRSLRAAWRGDSDPGDEFVNHPSKTTEATGYWQIKPGAKLPGIPHRPLFTMGQKATLSAGVVIAHKSVPLPTVLEALWDAEKNGGKAMPGKDGFCFRVIYGNGNQLNALMSGELLEDWWKCIGDLNEQTTSLAPALYRLSEELPLRADVGLVAKAAKVMLDRREEQMEDHFQAILSWLEQWEVWAGGKRKLHQQLHQQLHQPSENAENPPGTRMEDLVAMLRFTAFWVAHRVERYGWASKTGEEQ